MAAAVGAPSLRMARRLLGGVVLGRVPRVDAGQSLRLGASAAAAAAGAAGLAALAATDRPLAQQPARWPGAPGPAARCEAAKAALGPPAGFEAVEEFPKGLNLKDCAVRVYQYESCPFCRKVRACLDYNRVPYEIVEVHPLNKNESKVIAPDYRKVPVLRVDGEENNFRVIDSKTIVRALLGSKNPGVTPKVPSPTATPATGKMWPESEAKGSIEAQWIRWTDLVLVQCIVLNVYRTMGESAETFQYLLTHPSFPWYAQKSAAWSGTVVMWGVSKARKRKYEIADERVALYEAVDLFADAVKSGGGRFLGGKSPGAVDFNVYGILRSAESCQTERDFFENCPKIRAWYDAMHEVCGPSCAVNIGDVKRG